MVKPILKHEGQKLSAGRTARMRTGQGALLAPRMRLPLDVGAARHSPDWHLVPTILAAGHSSALLRLAAGVNMQLCL